jgi:hypothetical protein
MTFLFAARSSKSVSVRAAGNMHLGAPTLGPLPTLLPQTEFGVIKTRVVFRIRIINWWGRQRISFDAAFNLYFTQYASGPSCIDELEINSWHYISWTGSNQIGLKDMQERTFNIDRSISRLFGGPGAGFGGFSGVLGKLERLSSVFCLLGADSLRVSDGRISQISEPSGLISSEQRSEKSQKQNNQSPFLNPVWLISFMLGAVGIYVAIVVVIIMERWRCSSSPSSSSVWRFSLVFSPPILSDI